MKAKLCQLDDLAVGASRGFSVATPGGIEDIFLVRTPGHVVAYHNSCPHTGGPLDWVPDQFLSLEGDLIQCATHAAMFRIEDGRCVKGPCAGQALRALPVSIVNGQVWVEFAVSGGE